MWKGAMMRTNSGFLKSNFKEGRMASLAWFADGEHGVGGVAGMKKDGTAATVAWPILALNLGNTHFSIRLSINLQ